MKILSLTAATLLFSNFIFAQEQSKVKNEANSTPLVKIEKPRNTTTYNSVSNKSVTISKKAGQPQRVHDVAYFQEKIASIDAHIQAINTKIQFIQNDPTENSLAIQNDWYLGMDDIKTKLNAKKADYQQKINQQ